MTNRVATQKALKNQLAQNRRIEELEAEVVQLQTLVRSQAELITELQCRADPYSQDGTPIGDSFRQKDCV